MPTPLFRFRRLTPALLVGALTLFALAPAHAEGWPSFRGQGALGLAAEQSPPSSWQVKEGKNIRWRTEIPGLGHSSPIIWGDRVYVTTAVAESVGDLTLGDEGGIGMATDEESHTWMLLALDAETGEVVWRKEVTAGVPKVKRHVKASQANSTPATDGKVIAAIFGSEGLFVFDLDGKPLWKKDLGILDPGLFGSQESQWGYASSPLVVDGKVVVQVDRHEASFVAVYDAGSGEQLWKVDREERPGWATPTFYDGHGRKELIVMGGFYIRSYDFDSGKELWRFGDDAQVKTPTPFVVGDQVILAGGYRARPILSVAAGQSGDLSAPADATSGEHLRWRTEPGGPYTTTPIAYGDLLFSVTDKGILNVYNLKSGERLHRVRTDEHFSASPVAADGKLYFAGEGGEVLVVKADQSLEILSRNDMGEACMATPAIADDSLFIRTTRALYAIADTKPTGKPSKAEPAKGAKAPEADRR